MEYFVRDVIQTWGRVGALKDLPNDVLNLWPGGFGEINLLAPIKIMPEDCSACGSLIWVHSPDVSPGVQQDSVDVLRIGPELPICVADTRRDDALLEDRSSNGKAMVSSVLFAAASNLVLLHISQGGSVRG